MPLPDADKKSPRVYTLLQNQDLENITADTLADVADPIAIEEANEDELRRLCLVAFARMVTKGSFDGWLTAGGGDSGLDAKLVDFNWDGDSDPVRVLGLPPFGTADRLTSQQFLQDAEIAFYAFIAPSTGTLSELHIYVGNANSGGTGAMNVGFYSDNNGLPQTFLGEFVMDTTSATTQVTQTTSSADIETVRGTQYWVGFYADTFASTPQFGCHDYISSASSPLQVAAYAVNMGNCMFRTGSSGNATQTDYTLLSPNVLDPPNIGVSW